MSNPNEKTIECLNGLIQTCLDGANGYRDAASALDAEPRLEGRFLEYAGERDAFATRLTREVRALGGEPESSGSFAGALHRGWLDIKSAIASQEKEAIVSECERGEDAALKNYNEALETIRTPIAVRRIVQAQQRKVREAHDHISALESVLETD